MKNLVAFVSIALAELGIACMGPTSDRTQKDSAQSATPRGGVTIQEFSVPRGSGPHDAAPAADGITVWFTAQRGGALGNLNPNTGDSVLIPLGTGAAPHGVIVGPDGAAWVTDGGLNAIVRVDATTGDVQVFPLPPPNANLNTATFDALGTTLWFTGQNGFYGRLNVNTGDMNVFAAPRGAGPYGISTTPAGEVYYASLAGNYVGRIDTQSAEVTQLDPPTARQGARRVWPDSQSRIWVSEWNVGQVALYDPQSGEWREWPLPNAQSNQAYAVFVDENDEVWLSDWRANAMVRFDPTNESFDVFPLPSSPADVRQILGRPGEVWAAESGVDQLVVLRH